VVGEDANFMVLFLPQLCCLRMLRISKEKV
jgi:hypothetical protein